MFGMRFDKSVRRAAWAHGVGLAAIVASMSVAACEGCRSTANGGGAGSASSKTGEASAAADPVTGPPPTIRLYLVSDLAGALEPCGCTKDQLGGVDHLAAWIRSEQPKAPVSAVVAAGPFFFMEPTLRADHAAQDIAKAETIAAAFKSLGLAAFAPGLNDFSAGAAELAKLADASGAAWVEGNGAPIPPEDGGAAPAARPFVIRELNGVKVAFIGARVGAVNGPGGMVPADGADPSAALKADAARAKQEGAAVVIALASVGRGIAKRLAENVPQLTAILVGSPGGSGEANTAAPPPERVGDVIIAEMGNHLTSVGVLDLFVRDGSFAFADATGLELGTKRADLTRRIDDLRAKLAAWEKDAKIQKADLDARRADLQRLEAERTGLEAPRPPSKGSFFRYTIKEMRPALGSDPQVNTAMLAYYKQINEHNKVAFANRLPPSHTPEQPTYVGVNACSQCHKEARAVWDKTRHAKAYPTLSTQFKEFNLDCVSCHVTGYDQPGGSTVTHVDKLENVQCEVCHGPGSKHALNPKKVAIPVAEPKGDMCISACHHPPHVEHFDPAMRMADILGPGHGL
jgi:hypothetical protein